MKEVNKVKLHGVGVNPYSKRVKMALRIKGIPYEYIEEDTSNKSQSLITTILFTTKHLLSTPLSSYNTLMKPGRSLLSFCLTLHFTEPKLASGQMSFNKRVVTCDGEVQAKAVDEMYVKMRWWKRGLRTSFKPQLHHHPLSFKTL
ncbi:hypothetical protein CXB51_032530 [Gossypium anomalum]|uniref:GST N-terminal domain-containing protein n=1 Tax=Gossypium anomalum TaxID=47600 RepID=A0A8J5YD15_9ROSI|nr:hypothetical protein CXB51_032530 [Gossypium anomalum]